MTHGSVAGTWCKRMKSACRPNGLDLDDSAFQFLLANYDTTTFAKAVAQSINAEPRRAIDNFAAVYVKVAIAACRAFANECGQCMRDG